MGYTTDFSGQFTITPALSAAQAAYINAFSGTRRMKRDSAVTAARPDPVRAAVGLPVGDEGGYFVGAGGMAGQEEEWGAGQAVGVLEYNTPPAGQPGLWCQWVVSDDGAALEWDGGEKFYDYVEWLEYLVQHFIAPWGSVLAGEVQWSGEDRSDQGIIYAKDNKVAAVADTVTNEGPDW